MDKGCLCARVSASIMLPTLVETCGPEARLGEGIVRDVPVLSKPCAVVKGPVGFRGRGHRGIVGSAGSAKDLRPRHRGRRDSVRWKARVATILPDVVILTSAVRRCKELHSVRGPGRLEGPPAMPQSGENSILRELFLKPRHLLVVGASASDVPKSRARIARRLVVKRSWVLLIVGGSFILIRVFMAGIDRSFNDRVPGRVTAKAHAARWGRTRCVG